LDWAVRNTVQKGSKRSRPKPWLIEYRRAVAKQSVRHVMVKGLLASLDLLAVKTWGPAPHCLPDAAGALQRLADRAGRYGRNLEKLSRLRGRAPPSTARRDGDGAARAGHATMRTFYQLTRTGGS
jgi:hypothetical protein